VNRRFHIWYRNPGSDFENGPWTGYGTSHEAAICAMHSWFAECGGSAPVIVTRYEEAIPDEELIPATPDAYDPAAVLRALRWVEPGR
jgi:hypothetical protein